MTVCPPVFSDFFIIGVQDWFYPIKQDSRSFLTESQFQARFKNKIKLNLNFKQDLRIWQIKISISSKIQELRIQNLNFEQDLRMTKDKSLAANESKIHLQNLNLDYCCKYWVEILFWTVLPF
jgi:hypothetical protein